MFEFIAEILSIFIRPIYSIVQNYGWTIIIFTILIKLVTMPFTVKSQKSMARMQQVQPLISEIQRKYANNREKMQEELMKVYDKYDVSPTGGCMPMILQLVVLMGFIDIVYRPYTYLLGIPKSVITSVAAGMENIPANLAQNQLAMPGEVLEKLGEMGYNTTLHLNFLGIDLSKILSQNMGDIIVWILPVLAVALTILSTVISQKSAKSKQNPNAKKDEQAAQAEAMTKPMLLMMPVMTAWITYSWPLGCALYWCISTVTQLMQQAFINEFIVKKMKPIDLKKKKKKPKTVKPVIETEGNTKD